jgi:cell division septum initiation protein DivIVA
MSVNGEEITSIQNNELDMFINEIETIQVENAKLLKRIKELEKDILLGVTNE